MVLTLNSESHHSNTAVDLQAKQAVSSQLKQVSWLWLPHCQPFLECLLSVDAVQVPGVHVSDEKVNNVSPG